METYNMNAKTIIARWKKAGRIFILSLLIGTFILFVFIGFFANYEQNEFTSRWQMVLLMVGLGSMCSLIFGYMYLWVIVWKLEIKNDEVIISAFLKKKRYYSLSKLTIEKHGVRTAIKMNEKTVAWMFQMIESCDEVVRAIESGHVMK